MRITGGWVTPSGRRVCILTDDAGAYGWKVLSIDGATLLLLHSSTYTRYETAVRAARKSLERFEATLLQQRDPPKPKPPPREKAN